MPHLDYSFVKSIADGGVEAVTLNELRRTCIPGSHVDAILREALLDRPRQAEELPRRIVDAARDGHLILSSFPDQRYHGARLLVRSEFLILGEVGAGRLDVDDTDGYVSKTVRRLAAVQPASVMYRCLDYNAEEFGFLPSGMLDDGRPTRVRGVQRLLEQPALLDLDCRIVQGLVEAAVPVQVLVPFIQFPEQFAAIATAVRTRLSHSLRDPRIGMMVEVPANLFQLDQFSAAEFFVFGPGDLLKHLFGGVERNDALYRLVSTSVLAEPVRHAMATIEAVGHKQVFFAKTLIALAGRLRLSTGPGTVVRNVYTPDQLLDPAP